MKWTVGTDGGKPALYMVIGPDGPGKNVTLLVPNKGSGDSGVRPSNAVASVGEQLRIGEKVRVAYSALGKRVEVTGLSDRQPLATEALTVPFTFMRLARVRDGKTFKLVLTARRGANTWVFTVPGQTNDKGAVVPAGGLAGKFSGIKPLDLVELDYDAKGYQFHITDIRPGRASGKGKFLGLRKRTVNGQVHQLAVVAFGSTRLLLTVPAGTGEGAPASHAAAVVEQLRAGQDVRFNYRREGGVCWLDDIGLAPTKIKPARTSVRAGR